MAKSLTKRQMPIKTTRYNRVQTHAILLYANSNPRPLTFQPKSMSLLGYPKVIPYTKFKNFGIICFLVMLRTKTDKHGDELNANRQSRHG